MTFMLPKSFNAILVRQLLYKKYFPLIAKAFHHLRIKEVIVLILISPWCKYDLRESLLSRSLFETAYFGLYVLGRSYSLLGPAYIHFMRRYFTSLYTRSILHFQKYLEEKRYKEWMNKSKWLYSIYVKRKQSVVYTWFNVFLLARFVYKLAYLRRCISGLGLVTESWARRRIRDRSTA